MTRIDRLLLRRIGGRIFVTVLVFYGIIILVDSLDTWRFTQLSNRGGPQLAVLGILISALHWTIKTLTVTVLLGAIIGLLELQRSRELTIIKAAGISIWRVIRAPVIGIFLFGIVVTFVGDNLVTAVNRDLNPTSQSENGTSISGSGVWLEQSDNGVPYIITAAKVDNHGVNLSDVAIFFRDTPDNGRIVASAATLTPGAWKIEDATRLRAAQPPEPLPNLTLATTMTAAELSLRLTATDDYTLYELLGALEASVGDPTVAAAAATRVFTLLAIPGLLVGALLIAFAFTAGYRRTHKYGATILYGVVLGLVVFVLTEMADRAGSAGVLAPAVAAGGPAFIAVLIGLTVLLYKEDGRA
ncbi:MAG TPA: LptF/LptG family permease [Devosiaceae bacterium]|jgi:lipopolysaccharide export system permease protein